MMGNFNIINFVFCIILLLLVIGLFSYIGKMDDKFDKYKEEMDAKYDYTSQIANDAKYSYTSMKNKLNSEQNQLVDLWFSMRPKEVMDKFELWEEQNKDLISCDKTFIDAEIVAEYADMSTYNISKARAVAFKFDKGVLLYERDGTIHCYALPIMTYTAHDVPCNIICDVQECNTCIVEEIGSNVSITVEDEKKE